MLLYSCSLAAFQAAVEKCARVLTARKRHPRTQAEGAGQSQPRVGFGPRGFACVSARRDVLFPSCAWAGRGWGWDAEAMLRRPAEAEGVPAAEGDEWKGRKRGSCALKRDLLAAAVGCLGLGRWPGRAQALPAHPADTHPGRAGRSGLGVGSVGTHTVKEAAGLRGWDGSCWCFPHQLRILPP